MMIAGLDGCQAGWFSIVCEGQSYHFKLFENIEDFFQANPGLDFVFVDIPIGLSSKGFSRTIDTELRKQLKGRSSTVFTPPCREALSKKGYSLANETQRKITEKGLSIQSYNISEKIMETDHWIRNNRPSSQIVFESHPELCFMKLNANQLILESKHGQEGKKIRYSLIQKHDPQLAELFPRIKADFKNDQVKSDDILDAMALCLSARYAHKHGISLLTDDQLRDQQNIKIQIAFSEIPLKPFQ